LGEELKKEGGGGRSTRILMGLEVSAQKGVETGPKEKRKKDAPEND